ncbi:ribonuclease H-like domain-containing protein [Tanacetum coccineum]
MLPLLLSLLHIQMLIGLDRCPVSRRSTSGYYYMAMEFATRASCPLTTTTLVYFDNVSVVYLSTNPVQHQRTKHIEIDIHFVRDYVASGQVHVLHVPSRFQYADIFTEGLPSALFCDFRSSLNVRSPPVTTAGEY